MQKGTERAWSGRQYTSSIGHYKTRSGAWSGGGPFFTYLTHATIPTSHVVLSNAAENRYYSGPATCALVPKDLANQPTPNGGGSETSDLDPYGAEAIARTNPMDPNANAGVALGEILKDRRISIPGINLWKRRTLDAKLAGSEYLNAVFGWQPLVDDMKNTAQSVLDGNTILENYSSNAGSNVHREFAFDPIVTSTEGPIGTVHPGYGGGTLTDLSQPSVVNWTQTKTVRRWFSGSFTYHAPSDRSSFQKTLGIGSEAHKLLGLSLTPELVWELTPWSWAIDWFSNAGDVISNISSMKAAGLVMRYGYIMEETSILNSYSQVGRFFHKGKEFTRPLHGSTKTVVKRRGVANPFGFGVKWEGLSPAQLAITAALGITRLR